MSGGFPGRRVRMLIEADGPDAAERARQALNGLPGVIVDIEKRDGASDGPSVADAQRMDALGRLAGGIAHEFNNLLTAILGYGEMLVEELDATDVRRRDAQEVCKAADRGSALTRQLLAFGRRQVLQPTPVDVASMLVRLEDTLRALVGNDVRLDITSEGAAVALADPGQVEHAVSTLTKYARTQTPAGGRVAIRLSTEELPASRVGAHPGVAAGRYARIDVADQGPPLGDALLAHLFEPFYSVDNRGKGRAMALASVYGIARQSGGFVEAARVDGGTNISMYLPTA